MKCGSILLLLIGSILTLLALPTLDARASTAQSIRSVPFSPAPHIIVDDYTTGDDAYPYSRIGTDRGKIFSDGAVATMNIADGCASVEVERGSAGCWISMLHGMRDRVPQREMLDPRRLLGPYVAASHQAAMTGIEVVLRDGTGTFEVELKGAGQEVVFRATETLSGGPRTLRFPVNPEHAVKLLNWQVVGRGSAQVDEVRLQYQGPVTSASEAWYLYSYGHLSQCYDAVPAHVRMRDRACLPAETFGNVTAMGTFALATAAGADLGYIETATAEKIYTAVRDALLNMPTLHGLLPHFTSGDNRIYPDSEWSSIDTSITLLSTILAGQILEADTSALEDMIRDIDWNGLTDNGTRSISHGYANNGELLPSRWDTFGSETFLVGLAYTAGTGGKVAPVEGFPALPTFDGSGFNDEMAALLMPMKATDQRGNHWLDYRRAALREQLAYPLANRYVQAGLFGLSASEVPDPWKFPPNRVYGAWGVGGHNGTPHDGSDLVGFPIIAPHYSAMVLSLDREKSAEMLHYLGNEAGIFTPLNNVESLGLDDADRLHWNSIKGSWNLGLAALGAARAISQVRDVPYASYRALAENRFLSQAYERLLGSDTLSPPPTNERATTDLVAQNK